MSNISAQDAICLEFTIYMLMSAKWVAQVKGTKAI